MRCLYCGKELALLKRLTGSEFCSDAHKQSYQDEYNRLALSRLLQAQSKSDEIKSKAAKETLVAKQADPGPEPKLASERKPESEVKAPELKPEPESRPQPERQIEREPIVRQVEAEPELVASSMADFSAGEKPLVRDMAFESKPIPALPVDWLPSQPSISVAPSAVAPTEVPALPFAVLVALDLRSPAIASEQPHVASGSPVPHASHREFSGDSLNMNIPIRPALTKKLRCAETLPLAVGTRVPAAAAVEQDERVPDFQFEMQFHESARLELALTAIEFPAEDADVIIPEPGDGESDVPETNGTPRGALQALAKLHKAIKEENSRDNRSHEDGAGEEVRPNARPVTDTTGAEWLFGTAPGIPAHAARQEKPLPDGGGSVVVAVSKAEVTPPELEAVGVARAADQLLTMPVKLFAPEKARLAAGFPALAPQPEPEIPRPDVLPLRPKVAINKSAVPPEKVEEPKSSPAPVVKKAEPAAPPPKTPLWSASEAKTSASEAKTSAPETTKPVRAVSIPTPPPAPTATPLKEAAPAKETRSPVAAAPPKPKDPEPTQTAEKSMDLDVPNLMLTSSSGGFLSALSGKTKIAVAMIAILIAAVLGYVAFGGSKKAGGAASKEAIATSIMMGEGGWVTNWAGDSTGLHRGRQITVYRPSLKLTDCRIEFQGRMVNNSIGWVFRTVDAGNYYAMKITLSSGFKLQKYAVINGQEHYAGEVALTAPSGGLFSIRVDVRGPRFSTYIQGQPVDIWTDNQLKAGGVGFLNDRGDRAEIKNVSISYLTGVGN